ncbi:hypothetical protein L0F63_005843 [Massospora cicadina]|nr:hypothetical protein L0F63_005843 [Massospora cicadina]
MVKPLSLLLKLNERISRLALYDIVNVPGVASDIGHINTPAQVTSHLGPDSLIDALNGADVVVIPAGVPRKPGMTRDDLFKINAGIVRDLANAAAKACPKAFMLIISNPVNSTTPIVAEVFRSHGCFDPRRIFGVTTLDSVRASSFVSEASGGRLKPHEARLPVIGGHSGATIVPLFSQVKPSLPTALSEDDLKALINRVQYGGDEVVKAKGGAGSATLSMAHAGARFVNSILEAFSNKGVIEPAYVHLDADPEARKKASHLVQDASYFAFDLELSSRGVERIIVPESLSSYEIQLTQDAVTELTKSIQKGIDFVKTSEDSKL